MHDPQPDDRGNRILDNIRSIKKKLTRPNLRAETRESLNATLVVQEQAFSRHQKQLALEDRASDERAQRMYIAQ